MTKTTEPVLEPCVCGAQPSAVHIESRPLLSSKWQVQCDCTMAGPIRDTEAEAAAAWNNGLREPARLWQPWKKLDAAALGSGSND